MHYKNNPTLKTIKKNYPGNSMKGKRFRNEYKGPKFSFPRLFKDLARHKGRKAKLKRKEKEKITVVKIHNLPTKNKDSLIWLGHSSFLLTLNKKRILIDPQLSSYFYLKRKIALPIKPEALIDIDYLCLSHRHRDHYDKATLKKIKAAKNAKALVPLGLKKRMEKLHLAFDIDEAGWFQQYKKNNIQVTFMPAKHWTNSYLLDFNRTLWGSFILQSPKKTVFFCGDTAYTKHFKEIHQLFPDIDICIMPIGAYEPPEMLLPNHMNPQQSVKAFNILKGRKFIPMHYGTFKLGDDSAEVSLKILKQKMKQFHEEKKLCVPDVGEIVYL